MTLYQAFRDGGAGMYPVMVFGTMMVASAVRYALRPQPTWVPLMMSLGLLTLLSGCLGFVAGVMATFRAAAQLPADQHTPIAMVGLAESMHNLAFALILMIISTLMAVIGAYRLAQRAAISPAPAR